MAIKRVEVYTGIVQEKTLPGWLRGKGYRLLVGEFLPGWGGPEPEGQEVCHACTIHSGGTVSSPGAMIWFLLPKEQKSELSEQRLQEAAYYVFERLGRKAHEPKSGLQNVVFLTDEAAGKN